jgi:hypothetical protein
MLTPDELRAMKPEDQTQLFESMAERFYGTTQYNTKISEDFGVSRPTVFRWKRENATPYAVIYTLDAWIKTDANYTRILQDWQTLPEALAEVTRGLTRTTGILTTLARRMPAALPDAAKSFDPEQS